MEETLYQNTDKEFDPQADLSSFLKDYKFLNQTSGKIYLLQQSLRFFIM